MTQIRGFFSRTSKFFWLTLISGLVLLLVIAALILFKANVAKAITGSALQQQSTVVAGGQPVKWSILIKQGDISREHYLLKLPASAQNIKIAAVSRADAQNTLHAPKQAAIPLEQRVSLALSRPGEPTNGKAIAYLAAAGESAINLLSPSSKIVDLSSHAGSKISASDSARLQSALGDLVFTLQRLLSRYLGRVLGISIDPNGVVTGGDDAAAVAPSSAGDSSVTSSDGSAATAGGSSDSNSAPSNSPAVNDNSNPANATSQTGSSSSGGEVSGQALAGSSSESQASSAQASTGETGTSTFVPALTASDSPVGSPITSSSSLASSADQIVKVDFETPAPAIAEQETSRGKLVTVAAEGESSDCGENSSLRAERSNLEIATSSTPRNDGTNGLANVCLTDVLASTKIPKIYKVGEEAKIHIKWKNNGNQEMSFHAYDTDHDGYLDYVEWTIPHLSEQIFEIIFISKAFELDADQNIVADIYDKTGTKDGNYAGLPSGHSVRVTFNSILDSTKDITVYAKPSTPSTSASIEVYPVYTDSDGNQVEGSRLALVADNVNPDFSNIDHDGKYRVLLQNLSQPTEVFDLRVIASGAKQSDSNSEIAPPRTPRNDDSLDIDYIVDPTVATYCWTGPAGGNTSVAANWSTTPNAACGVSTGGAVPDASSTVIFSSGCTNNATIDQSWTLTALTLAAGYTGTVTASTTGVASTTIYTDLTVASGTLAIGTNDLVVSGNSTVTGKLTIGNSAGTGWTTGNLTIGAGGIASSTAPIYYNQVTVSGTLSPDASGVYTVIGVYKGYPIYRRGSDSWYIRVSTTGNSWNLVDTDGSAVGTVYWIKSDTPPSPATGTYAAGGGGASGTATVANVATSSIYYGAASKVTISGTFDQSSVTSKFLAGPSLITVNGNGNFTTDFSLNPSQFNNSSLILNGTNKLTVTNLTGCGTNGFNNLTVGQNGNTTTLVGFPTIRSVLTVGSGTFTGSGYVYLTGASPMILDVNSRISILCIYFFAANQSIPVLANGYDTDIYLIYNGGKVIQTGDITINSPRQLFINAAKVVSTATTWNTNGYNLTVGGNLTIGAGSDTSLKKLDATNYSNPDPNAKSTITIGGNWLNYGNGTAPSQFIAATSTVVFTGTDSSNTITSGTTTSPFYNLQINGTGGTYTLQDPLVVAHNLTLTNGTLDTKSGVNNPVTIGSTGGVNGDFTQSTTAKFLAHSSTITLNGNGNFTADGTVDSTQYNNVSLVLNGNNTLTYNNGSSNVFNNLTGGQGGNTTTIASSISVNSLTIGSGVLTQSGSRMITLTGASPLSFDINSTLSIATLRFYSGSPQTIPSLTNGYDCSISVYTYGSTLTQTGNVTLTSTHSLTINDGANPTHSCTWKTDGYNLTVGGNLTIGNGSDTYLQKLDATHNGARTSTITVGGNWLNYGNGTVPSQFVADNSTVIMTGTGSGGTITSGTTTSPFYNLQLNGTGGTYTLQDSLVVSHNLTLANGTLDTGSNRAVTIGSTGGVNGDFTQSTTAKFTARSSTITLNGNGNFTADGTVDPTQYNNASLVLNGVNTLTYNNFSTGSENGFNILTVGQNGNTTKLNTVLATRSSLVVGSGTLMWPGSLG